MAYTAPARNYDGIEYEAARRAVDPLYGRLHDTLSTAYYDYWRQGKKFAWNGYDAQATAKDSKALFDKLHAQIEVERQAALADYNAKTKTPDTLLTAYLSAPVSEGGFTTRAEAITAKVAEGKAAGADLAAAITAAKAEL